MSVKIWKLLQLDKESASGISEELNLPFFLSMLLDIRGMTDRAEIQDFLGEGDLLSDPFELVDMEPAVARIQRALDGYEKICVYGDYDADGVTATALLYSYLESAGADVMYYIPEREGEGYGLNLDAVDSLAAQGVRLIVTVDNGIASVAEVERSAQLGVDVVVTDHHRPQERLPQACAVVDPHREDCGAPFREYSGVGVALKLAMALESAEGDPDAIWENYADLAAIGTIGDVVPLFGENRAIVKKGLKSISNTDRIGLRSLMDEAGLTGGRVTAGNVAFTLVPRINAAGRLGSSERSVRMLLSEYREEADLLSASVGEDNRRRQQIEADILKEAEALLEREPERRLERVLVVEGEGWHAGVIGIVAARLVEKYGRPTVVLAIDGEEAKGSGRSVAGFSLHEAVCACAPLLTRFGGHPMAAGVSLKAADVPAFRRAINDYARSLPEGMPYPAVTIDCKLNPAALSTDLVRQIALLEPFGCGNAAPLFGLYGMTLREITPVGGGKHLRLKLSRGNSTVTAMRFHTTKEAFPYREGDCVDLAVTLERSEYRGMEQLSVFIREIRPAGFEAEDFLRRLRDYEAFRRGEDLPAAALEALTPNRDEFAAVYRFLRAEGGWNAGLDQLYWRLQKKEIGPQKLLIILDCMENLSLIEISLNGETYTITLKAVSGKVDLESSVVLSGLRRRAGR